MENSGEPTRKLPGSFYNILSITGAAIAAFSFVAIIFLFIVDFFTQRSTPYLGIINYVIFPTILILGLLCLDLQILDQYQGLL